MSFQFHDTYIPVTHTTSIKFPDTYIPVTHPIRKRWSDYQNRSYDHIYTMYMLTKNNTTESFQEYYSKRESADAISKLFDVVCNLKQSHKILEPFSFNV